MSLSHRNHSKDNYNSSFEQTQKEPPLWKSPLIWLCGIAGALIIGIPLLMDGFTHRVISVLMIDVSLSNLPYKASLEALCHQYIEYLVEGDTNIQGKFADKVAILSNQEFQERDRLLLQNQCKQIALQPPGIGKAQGTSLIDALTRLETEIQHQQSQGNNQSVAAVIVIQSAELVNHQQKILLSLNQKLQVLSRKEAL
ncbi:hypothetical protein [Fischerella sp. JS2]|uniref:hypothetical protein n=1 Tax=Fischerella sp. JS2 TaxID=2597771 RepID=UPI0028EA78C2|nr:hypothetical protein [Fischerella sp. JS2]